MEGCLNGIFCFGADGFRCIGVHFLYGRNILRLYGHIPDAAFVGTCLFRRVETPNLGVSTNINVYI